MKSIPFLMIVAAMLFEGTVHAAAPTFQELMNPDVFTTPQCGMVVESARQKNGEVRVVTTGAEIVMREGAAEIVFRQRIAHPREVAVMRLSTPLQGVELKEHNDARVMIAIRKPNATIRINGDSLVMIQAHESTAIAVDSKILPAWHASFKTNHLVADEFGAFGLFCSEMNLDDHFDPYDAAVARYDLPKNAVLWLGVCPPKPYDSERSLRDNVVWHWSRTLAYPPDDVLRSWKPYGNIVLLQAEVMLWKNWNLAFEPRLGVKEFERVRKTIHSLGMRFIVYTSPYYFLKGTPVEKHAINSFKNFKGWPPGWGTGENMDLFLKEITHVMRDLKPDGLYFDGQYSRNPAALYALARKTRAILGEDGILEWHSTSALGSRQCYLPQADAYVDFILRGEGRQALYGDLDYLRFFVSGYNISNSIGVVCNNGATGLTPKLVDDALLANARFHFLVGWLKRKGVLDLWRNRYTPRLTPTLRDLVEKNIRERQTQIARKVAAARAEREALKNPPAWKTKKAAFELTFAHLPKGNVVVSPRNAKNPFSVGKGDLIIRAHAHTYAYYRIPLKLDATGFVVKIRHDTDEGMSWGPGAMLIWPDGKGLRLGTRSDGTLQADVLGSQFYGKPYDPRKWIWLRARWTKHLGVIEASRDGVHFKQLWTFEHGGAFCKPTAEILAGKVPYNGKPVDYKETGPLGQCEIGEVLVFGNP